MPFFIILSLSLPLIMFSSSAAPLLFYASLEESQRVAIFDQSMNLIDPEHFGLHRPHEIQVFE